MRFVRPAIEALEALVLAGYYLLKEWFGQPAQDSESLEVLAEIAQVDPDAAHDTAYALCKAIGADKIAEEYGLAGHDRHRIAEHFSKLYQPGVRTHVVDGALEGFLDYDKEHV